MRDPGHRATVRFVGVLFLLSGAAGLVDQVAWQRILGLASGVGVTSVALIVAAFMAGLGLGSLLGGAVSTRLSPRQALAAFALLEVAVGTFAASSGWLYYDLLYRQAPWLYRHAGLAGAAHFLALLPPTLLMGMSLPLLVRATVRDASEASHTIGFLYGINIVGAALGAVLTPWLLIRHLGIVGAVRVGGALSALAGLGALALSGRVAAPETGAPAPRAVLRPEDATNPEDRPGGRPFALWLLLYTVSGLCALSLEIVWFRIVDVTAKSSAFTFGTVLALYLAGLGAGTFAGTLWADRLRRPLLVFLACQALLIGYAAGAAALLARLPVDLPVYAGLLDYWRRYSGLVLGREWDPAALFVHYLLVPGLLYVPATVLMGVSFPVLQKAVHDDPTRAGHRVGLLQAGNIAGCVAGSLLVGLVALDGIGTTGSLRLLVGCGGVFVALGLRHYGPRPVLLVAAGWLAVDLVALPGQERFWSRLHGRSAEVALVAEDASSVVVVAETDPGRWRLSVNGQGHSQLPYGGTHTLLGALPVLVHPAPENVAIVGLGSGDTAWAAGCRRATVRLDVFEIAAPQRPLLDRLSERFDDAPLRALLRDPRVVLQLEDGRHALRLAERPYDVVEMDVLEPYKSLSGNLNSVEFYRLVAERLAPGGVACAWVPRSRIQAGFHQVFPHVLATAEGNVLIGSREPLDPDRAAWAARLDEARFRLGDQAAAVARALRGLRPAEPGELAGVEPNHDLFPADEFLTPLREDDDE